MHSRSGLATFKGVLNKCVFVGAVSKRCVAVCRLEEESGAFFSSGRLWDDGVILPRDTRKVKNTLPTSEQKCSGSIR